MRTWILLAFVAASSATFAAQPYRAGATDFDFWVGNWNVSGKVQSGGKLVDASGTNRISKIMDGHALQENFKMGPTTGSSWSVFSPKQGVWHQTWIDNSGAYIPLTGTFANGEMHLHTPPDPAHPEAWKRMNYHNISARSFDWEWEGTTDGGKTWTLLWHLHYTRQ